MGFKDRIRRLERTEHADVIKLSDGTELRIDPTDRLESLLAALDGEQNHWLGELLQDLHPDSPVRDHELAGLLKAIEGPEDVSYEARSPGPRGFCPPPLFTE